MYSLTVRLLVLCHYTEYQAQCIAPLLLAFVAVAIVGVVAAALVPDEAPPARRPAATQRQAPRATKTREDRRRAG
jgi:hypothetical protein